jgi:hypothetical protein
MSLGSITPHHPSVAQTAALAIVQGALEATAGWAFGRIFHFVSPGIGAAFGLTLGISHSIAAAFLDRMFGSSDIEKVAKFILSFIASTFIAIGVVTLLGHKMAIETGFLLTIGIIPVRLFTDCVFSCLLQCAQAARA